MFFQTLLRTRNGLRDNSGRVTLFYNWSGGTFRNYRALRHIKITSRPTIKRLKFMFAISMDELDRYATPEGL